MKRCSSRRGVTLIEMVIVVALAGLIVAIAFPAASAGIDTVRLNSATDSIVSFFNEALNRAERRQEAVEVTIVPGEHRLRMRSSAPGFEKTLVLADGVVIRSVLPADGRPDEEPRRFMLYPGGTPPRFGLDIANARGVRRVVRVDPVTGVPRIERVQ